jgi:hypothetical protein
MNIENHLTYTIDDLVIILKLGKRTLQKKITRWDIKAKNVGTNIRAVYRVLWKDILDYLNK